MSCLSLPLLKFTVKAQAPPVPVEQQSDVLKTNFTSFIFNSPSGCKRHVRLLQDVIVLVCHAQCALTHSYMNQQQSTDVRQDIYIDCVCLCVWSLPHCPLSLHSSAGYLSLAYVPFYLGLNY